MAQGLSFDSAVATGVQQPNLFTGDLVETPAGPGRSAYDLGVAAGIPPEVARSFLAVLGLDETTGPELLLDFEEEDIATAKREFVIDETGSSPTALQRAQVNSWFRVLSQAAQHAAQPPRLEHASPDAPQGGPTFGAAGTAAQPPGDAATGAASSAPPGTEPEEANWPGFEAPPKAAAWRPQLSAPGAPRVDGQVVGHVRAGPLPSLSAVCPASALAPSAPVVMPGMLPASAMAAPATRPHLTVASPLLSPVGPAAAAVPSRRMGDVVDQGDPGTFVALSRGEVLAAWARHERATGVRPRPEAEPSAEQLGALSTLLRQGGAPAVDFAVWGPHDRRHARDQRTLAMVWVDGALQPRTLAGPTSFEAWDRAWGVFAAAMISLGAAAPGALARYRDGIRDLILLYPTLWGVVSRADEAMRFEQWARMALEDPPGMDWSIVLMASAYGEEGRRQVWWDRHVVKPASDPNPHGLVSALEGYNPRGASLLHSARPQPHAAAVADPSAKRSRTGRRERGGGADDAADAAPPAAPAAPPAKTKVCFAFNAGKCRSPCKSGFPHHCVICKQLHAACDVPACKAKTNAAGRPNKKA